MKQITNYPDYKVATDGTVISYKHGKTKVLKPQLVSQSQKKYLAVGLFNEHNRRNNRGEKVPRFQYIHRLVYEAYMGPIPENLEVDHIDENANEQIKFTTTASATNEITIANAAAGSSPVISATGGDTNVGLTLTPKAAQLVRCTQPQTSVPLGIAPLCLAIH